MIKYLFTFLSLFFSLNSWANDSCDVSGDSALAYQLSGTFPGSTVGTCSYYNDKYELSKTYSYCIEKGLYNNDPFFTLTDFWVVDYSSGRSTFNAENKYGTYMRFTPDDWDVKASPCSNDSNQFTLDQDAIDEFNAKAENMKGTATIVGDDQLVYDLQSLQENLTDLVDVTAQSIANSNAITGQASVMNDLSELNPDLSTLAVSADSVSTLSEESAILASDSIQSVTNYSDLIALAESASSSNNAYIDDLDAYMNDYNSELDIASSALDQDTYSDATVKLGTIEADFDNAVDNIKANNQVIDDANNATAPTTSTITNNSQTISNNYSDSTSIVNNSNTTVENGETCIGDTCVTIPDPTEPEEEDSEQSSFSHSTTDYESFEQANAVFVSSLKSSEVVNAANSLTNLIVVPAGECAYFSVDLSVVGWGTIGTDIQCVLLDGYSSVVSTISIILWTVAGFRIFFSA